MSKLDYEGALLCLWCGKVLVPKVELLTILQSVVIMRKHQIICTSNPLVRAHNDLKAQRKKMFWQMSLN